ncbi:hypothetical protein [Nonomuraea jiangxiensis]|uniref:Uncharacterized protein n=1 Tax=Nonomuraea jiangxiensis TaxID=633440 RepID=A0A1G8K5N4_9ACTN|nr:hypothetical protein [Nonomuraea jiangxiensis]SDI38731.1 hypothetical protein SAMN05421869_105292 [Nonomuraea jiangxiensis]
MPGRHAKVIVDPAVPDHVASLLRDNRKLLVRIHSGWVPERRRSHPAAGTAARLVATGTAVAAVVYGLALFVAERYTPFVVIMTGAALLIVGVLLRPRPDAEVERRHALERDVHDAATANEGRYVLRESLDDPARSLMSRAQTAIDQVMASSVNTEGLLDDVRNAVMLPAQEWEIARLLAKLSALRSEHQEVVSEGVVPEVAAVAEPLAHALDSSHQAVLARVEALERYAGHVAEAERAYRARNQIERLSARLPRYEELLAESGADQSAVPELSRLSDDADRLEQALRDSVSSAHEAFRHLRR